MTGKTVKDAAQFIAGRVDLMWPQHKDKLYKILSLVNMHAWKQGIWNGMTREYYTKVRDDGTICNPHGYSNLLKVNLNSSPVTIRGKYFQFHRNGNGSQTECCGKNWTTDVHDRGFSPVTHQPFKPQSCCCSEDYCQKIHIGCFSTNTEESGLKLTIYGCYPDGTPIYSYRAKDSIDEVSVPCDPSEAERVDKNKFVVSEGIDIPITNKVMFVGNVWFGEIRHITKPPTYGAVEVIAHNDHDGTSDAIARLEPPHKSSCYRTWSVPDICSKKPCVHGLWKVDKPGEFIYDNELMIFDDDEALISLAIACNLLWYQKNPEEAAKYFVIGAGALNTDVEQTESPAEEAPIQVRDVYDFSVNTRKRRMVGY